MAAVGRPLSQLAIRLMLAAAAAAKSGPVGEATTHPFDARALIEHAVGRIERNFPSGDLGAA